MRVWLVCVVALGCKTGPNLPDSEPDYPSLSEWVKLDLGAWWKKPNPCPDGAKLFEHDHWHYCAFKKKEVPPLGVSSVGVPQIHQAVTLQQILASANLQLGMIHGQLTIDHKDLRIDLLMYRGKVHGGQHSTQQGGDLTAQAVAGKLHGPAKVMTPGTPAWQGQFERGRLMSSTSGGKVEVTNGTGKAELTTAVGKATGQFKNGYAAGKWTVSAKDNSFSTEVVFTAPGKARAVSRSGEYTYVTEYEQWNATGWATSENTSGAKLRRRYVKGHVVERERFMRGNLLVRENVHYEMRDGKVTWYWPNGNVRVSGHYTRGKPDGKFEYFGVDGKRVTELVIQDGTGRFFSPEPRAVFNSAFVPATYQSLLHIAGYVMRIADFGNPSADLLGECEGELVKGQWKSVVCTLGTKASGLVIKGSFVDGKADGTWRFEGRHTQGSPFRGLAVVNFRKGLLHGIAESRIEAAQNGMSKYNFVDGFGQGKFVHQYGNEVHEGTYEKGVIVGTMTVRKPGQLETRLFEKGMFTKVTVTAGPVERVQCTRKDEQGLYCKLFDKRARLTGEGPVRGERQCKGNAKPQGLEFLAYVCAHGEWKFFNKGKVRATKTYDLGQAVK